jgi:hypothetical protein
MDADTLNLVSNWQPYRKTPRLYEDMIVTEKIDGTNACIETRDGEVVGTFSRNRRCTLNEDNHGFAAWVDERLDLLAEVLPDGLHYGEFWGSGIGRGYDLDHKRFSLFAVDRYDPRIEVVEGLYTVPVLLRHTFSTTSIMFTCNKLRAEGSTAAPGYPRPEGVCVFHTKSRTTFKVPFDK